MNAVRFFFVLVLLTAILTSCGAPQPAEVPETAAPLQTEPPPPPATNTPEPIPTLQPTDTPEGFIFRDDFTNALQDGWTWHDEKPDHWGIRENGWLQIVGEDASLLGSGSQSNLLCRPAPSGDFQVTVHLEAAPTANFQQATLYLYQDGVNYIAINRGFCGPCVNGGNGVYMEYKIASAWGSYKKMTADTDLWLRLTNKGGAVEGSYAFEEGVWQHMGYVGNFFAETDVCLGVSNVDNAGIDANLSGKFDYIEITKP